MKFLQVGGESSGQDQRGQQNARGGTRTPTVAHWILNPARLPISPPSLVSFLEIRKDNLSIEERELTTNPLENDRTEWQFAQSPVRP
jgi:hypothetical protein